MVTKYSHCFDDSILTLWKQEVDAIKVWNKAEKAAYNVRSFTVRPQTHILLNFVHKSLISNHLAEVLIVSKL